MPFSDSLVDWRACVWAGSTMTPTQRRMIGLPFPTLSSVGVLSDACARSQSQITGKALSLNRKDERGQPTRKRYTCMKPLSKGLQDVFDDEGLRYHSRYTTQAARVLDSLDCNEVFDAQGKLIGKQELLVLYWADDQVAPSRCSLWHQIVIKV